MKTLMCIVGIVVVAGAGTFVAGQLTALPQTRIIYAPGTDVTATELRYDPERRTTYARGGVRIVTESSTITADEADLHHLRATKEVVEFDIVFRGNVRMLLTPLP